MTLRERPGRPEREARLELRFGTVTIARPREAGTPELPAQVTLSLIELTEPDPPGASEPITWRLLTSHPVANTDAAWQIVDWYRRDGPSNSCFGCSRNKDCALRTAKSRPPRDCLSSSPLPLMPAAVTLQLRAMPR
jgi:hypothetical protein